MEASKIKEQLELARRLIDGEGTPSKQIAEGARIVRCLAENDDCLEAPVWISATGRMLSMRMGRGAETTPWGVSCMTSTVALRLICISTFSRRESVSSRIQKKGGASCAKQ